MNNNIIKILYEAESHEDLFLENQPDNNQRIKNGYLRTSNGNKRYKIDNYILRFIASELYAKNFGYEWRFFNCPRCGRLRVLISLPAQIISSLTDFLLNLLKTVHQYSIHSACMYARVHVCDAM